MARSMHGIISGIVALGIVVLASMPLSAQSLLSANYLNNQASGQTWFYADGSREYFLPNGSSYLWRGGEIAYHRWNALHGQMCFSGVGSECLVARSARGGQLSLRGQIGEARVIGRKAGDSEGIVRRYALGLQSAIRTGSLRLARSVAPDRNDPLGFKRYLRETDGSLTSKDGTVGRFIVPPQQVQGVLPDANLGEVPGQQTLGAGERPGSRPQALSQKAPETRIASSSTGVIFSPVVDRDPGCYLHLARCQRRCDLQAPAFSLVRQNHAQCRSGCQSTYICAR